MTAASACFTAAAAVEAAVDRKPPHQLPPEFAAGCGFSAGFFSDSCGSELVALGVKVSVGWDAVLSPDFRVEAPVSAAGGGGVLVEVRFAGEALAAMSRTRGV